MIITFNGIEYDVRIVVGKYLSNQVFVYLTHEGQPFGKLTYADSEVELGPDQILVKAWSENAAWFGQLLEHEAFTDTGQRVYTGYECEGQVWSLDRSKL